MIRYLVNGSFRTAAAMITPTSRWTPEAPRQWG